MEVGTLFLIMEVASHDADYGQQHPDESTRAVLMCCEGRRGLSMSETEVTKVTKGQEKENEATTYHDIQ